MADAILAQSGIYSITNTINGKRYIGQSADMAKRGKSHFGMLRRGAHHCTTLQRSFRKHGESAFIISIVEMCEPDRLTEREQFWMDNYRATGLYNLAPAAGSIRGVKFSAETIAKIVARGIGRRASDETKARMRSAQSTPRMRLIHSINGKKSVDRLRSPENQRKLLVANIGRVVSAGVREKMAAAQRGRVFPATQRTNIARAKTGSAHSEETKAKMSASQNARSSVASEKAVEQWARPGMRELLSESKRGTMASTETKAKLSAIAKARWADAAYVARVLEARRLGRLSRSAVVKT